MRAAQKHRTRYTPETLLPAFLELFRQFSEQVGPATASKLNARRVVKRHGSCNTVLMWKFWDRRQTDATLPINFNGYGINYDPDHFETTETDWVLKLKFNTVRVYHTGVDVRRFLVDGLRQVCVPGFAWTEHPRELRFEWFFDFNGEASELPDVVLPRLLELFTATYPVVDALLAALELADPRLEGINRKRVRANAANGARIAAKGPLNRGIPLRLRREVLQNLGNVCAICGEDILDERDIHIDHKKSFATGGLTILDNLQPTHASCNLRKGAGKVIPKELRAPAKDRRQRK